MSKRVFLPLLFQLKDSDRGALLKDLVAGLSTAIMLVPQAMAYAMLAGLDPVIGLYASTVPVVVYGLLGSSRVLAVGPVAMVSLLTAAAIAPLAAGDPVQAAGLAALLALMAGGVLLAMGLFRLGAVVRFLSRPVLAGFTSAAALIIGASQLKHLLGVDIARSHHVHAVLWDAWGRLGEANPVALVVGLATLGALMGLKRWAPRVPRFLVVVVLGTGLGWGLGLDLAIVGGVPAGLPGFALPVMDVEQARAMLPAALTIAVVGFMESIAVARSYARKTGHTVDANQELLALGAASTAAGLFGGYPVTGGFSRTAVNAQAGAQTGLAGLVTGLALALTLLFLTPLFHHLPKAVLAAIILSAVVGLVELHEAKHLWRTNRRDLVLMGLTFAATLGLGIEAGILVGVGASLAWFVWMRSTPHVAVLGRLPGTDIYRNIARYPDAGRTEGVIALRVDGALFFANSAFFKRTLEQQLAAAPDAIRHIVLDAKGIGSVDSTATAALSEAMSSLEAQGIQLWLAGVRGPVRDALGQSGMLDRLGPAHVVERVHQAVDQIVGVGAATS